MFGFEEHYKKRNKSLTNHWKKIFITFIITYLNESFWHCSLYNKHMFIKKDFLHFFLLFLLLINKKPKFSNRTLLFSDRGSSIFDYLHNIFRFCISYSLLGHSGFFISSSCVILYTCILKNISIIQCLEFSKPCNFSNSPELTNSIKIQIGGGDNQVRITDYLLSPK